MSDPACAHGFSAPRPDGTRAEPWLPEPDWWGRYGVDTQAADPASMLSLHRAAIATRRSESGLRDAAFAWLEISGAGNHVLAFSRGDVACVVNFGAEPASLPQHSAVLLASGDLLDGRLPTDTAVWLRL
jgi:alpha-glucosidase